MSKLDELTDAYVADEELDIVELAGCVQINLAHVRSLAEMYPLLGVAWSQAMGLAKVLEDRLNDGDYITKKEVADLRAAGPNAYKVQLNTQAETIQILKDTEQRLERTLTSREAECDDLNSKLREKEATIIGQKSELDMLRGRAPANIVQQQVKRQADTIRSIQKMLHVQTNGTSVKHEIQKLLDSIDSKTYTIDELTTRIVTMQDENLQISNLKIELDIQTGQRNEAKEAADTWESAYYLAIIQRDEAREQRDLHCREIDAARIHIDDAMQCLK